MEKVRVMNLQYISDNNGNTTGVFIPIKDWEFLKSNIRQLEKLEEDNMNVPEWHKKIVLQRLDDYRKNPENTLIWDEVKDKFKLE